ncbi:uncharacterized protein G2W53_026739 [Senna tora]|uniref:Uncharacterized protein n=1 Tax=Senna tora TaxID=362788 RepID=A0A834WLL6_9FABA|nr:uncharacterized protein G2W53_026739 [Senna tora]
MMEHIKIFLMPDHFMETIVGELVFMLYPSRAIGPDAHAHSAEDLADQIIENFNYFRAGVCGYGSLALGLSGGHLAAAVMPNSEAQEIDTNQQ